MLNNDDLKQLTWRIATYCKLNGTWAGNFVPLKLQILSELRNMHPSAVMQKDFNDSCMTKQSVSRCLIAMEKEGYIIRMSVKNSNNLSINLTSDGLRFVNYIFREERENV